MPACFMGQFAGNLCGSFSESFGMNLGGYPSCSALEQQTCSEMIEVTKKEKTMNEKEQKSMQKVECSECRESVFTDAIPDNGYYCCGECLERFFDAEESDGEEDISFDPGGACFNNCDSCLACGRRE